MRWLFWKKTPTVESLEEEVRADVSDAPTDADSPRLSDFTFDLSTEQQAALDEPPSTMADVVRAKAADRMERRRPRLAERGVGPMWVPSLRTVAQVHRLQAQQAADPRSALDAWQAYLTLVDDDTDAWFACGQVYLELGRFADAEAAFVTVRVLRPEHGLAAGALGFLSASRGAWQDACAFYEVAVATAPDMPDLAQALADARRRCEVLA